MFKFTLSEVGKMGDADEMYGQAYWTKATDSDTPIKFNSKNLNIGIGSVIEAEEKVMKKSTKGTAYWQLRKVRVLEESQEPDATRITSEPTSSQLDRIEELLNKILQIVDTG